jgi:predicted permease
MYALIQDLRYAVRQLRHTPGFAFVAIVTLALGIGANIAVLTLINGILLRPLPFAHPDGLISVAPANNMGVTSLSYADLDRLRAASGGRMQVAMHELIGGETANITAAGGRYRVQVDAVTSNLLDVLGVKPLIGRGFLKEENDPGKGRVVVISEPLWRKAFLADPAVLGKTVTIHEQVYTVVGVAPKGVFAALADGYSEDGEEMSLWTPAEITPIQRTTVSGDNNTWGTPLARLAPGVTIAQLSGVLNAEQTRIAAENSKDEMLAQKLSIMGFQEQQNHRAKRPLELLYAVSAAIWALACLNVTSLTLARSVARRREQAVRSALGASRSRLVRQAITESLLLSGLGSLAGLAAGEGAIKLLWRSIEQSLPSTYAVHVEWRVLLFLVVLTLVTAFLVGLYPALRVMRRDVRGDLQGGITATASIASGRTREALVVVQLAITLMLLTGAGLFLRTIHALRQTPLGFTQQNVLTGGIVLHQGTISSGPVGAHGENVAQTRYQPLLDKLRALPGVKTAVLSSVLPMRAEFQVTIMGNVDHKEVAGQTPRADGRVASPGLVETFGIPMLHGRFFLDSDSASAPPVVVINQAFADRYLKGLDPIGHSFSMAKDGRFSDMRIVGVIGDVKQGDVTRATEPEIYFAMAQTEPGTPLYGVLKAFMQVGIRATIPSQSLRAQMEKSLASVDPEATTTDVKTIHEAVEDSFGQTTLVGNLLGGFSGLALVIAAIGLYGLLAFLVAQRTRELGIRLALGAPRGNIFSLVLRRAVVLVVIGVALGGIASWFTAKLTESYLFGVKAHDGMTFAAVLVLLTATGLLASYLPAQRAASVDPMRALRSE